MIHTGYDLMLSLCNVSVSSSHHTTHSDLVISEVESGERGVLYKEWRMCQLVLQMRKSVRESSLHVSLTSLSLRQKMWDVERKVCSLKSGE